MRLTLKNNKSGLAAVELALIAPLLFLILFGIINYGIFLFDKAVITNAAREGARWASINATSECPPNTVVPDACSITLSYIGANLITFSPVDSSTLTVSYTDTLTTKCSIHHHTGCLGTVNIQYIFTGVGYLWPSIIGDAGTLKSVSKMYHE